MRKIVAGLFMSLDGVIESPDKWHFPYFNNEMGQFLGSQMAAADTMLLGRQTYQEFAGYWPHQTSDVEMADYCSMSCGSWSTRSWWAAEGACSRTTATRCR